MGYGIGRVGMSIGDFERCTPEEFGAICRAYQQGVESESRERWEQMRDLAAIVIQPHVRKRITPRQLVPLPWDGETLQTTEKPLMSKGEQLRRFERVLEREKK